MSAADPPVARVDDPSLGVRWSSAMAWGCLVVTEAAAGVAAVSLVASGLPYQAVLTGYGATNGWMAATFAPFGALVAYRRPRLAVGWLFCGFALCYGLSAAGISLSLWQLTSGGPTHVSSAVGWVALFIWTPAVSVFFPLILLLFPAGHLPARKWRWMAGLAVVNGAVWAFGWAFDSTSSTTPPFIAFLPFPPTSGLAHAALHAEYVGNILVGLIVLACLGSLVIRWRTAVGRTRVQLSWLLWGAVIGTALFAPTEFGLDNLFSTGLLVGVPVLPIAAAIAVLRYQLLDIDVVINRTLVYVGLTVGLLAAFLGVVELAALVVGHNAGIGGSLVAAAAVAVAFAPARQLLQRRVDTLLFGYRRDPPRALTSVVARLMDDTGDEVGAALKAVSDSLRLPDLVLSSDGRLIGPAPPSAGGETVIPLRYQSEEVGQLLAWPRRGQAALDASDLAALRMVAGPIATALHALRLSVQLQRSRQELSDARDEERRRLHRDLHDGLGPALTAIALRADAAGNVLSADTGKARAFIVEVAEQARQAISEVRRISHDLRPSGLDHLGLAGALTREAARFTSRLDGGPLVVGIELPDALPLIAPLLEDAAYQITTEALTNIARHSDATMASVHIRADRSLRLEIVDNGTPCPDGWPEGFGLASMRKRAAGAQGTLSAGPTRKGGRVFAEFPLEARFNGRTP